MPIQHVVLASGAVVAVSVAVATMIAIYESPEFRRYTEDVRRRIAMVIDSVNDSINPPSYAAEPRFNRPEDAEGFFLSRRAAAEPGVDADEESCRRQREELLYWNSLRLEKQRAKREHQASGDAEKQDHHSRRPSIAHHRGSSFDDFLRPDENGEKGSYVFNSGADVNNNQTGGGLRRRGEGARGFAAALSANPFADEHHIDYDELNEKTTHLLSPPNTNTNNNNEIMSDIYSATTPDHDERPTPTAGKEPSEPTPTPLFDAAAAVSAPEPSTPHELLAATTATLDRQLAEHEHESSSSAAAALQEDGHQVFASIQAWAHESGRDFYSPLPVTPVAPISEPELIGGAFSEFSSEAGELTPTDSLSLAGSGEDIANDMHESAHLEHGARHFDVLSESEGLETPSAWSEVGSEISESDAIPMHS